MNLLTGLNPAQRLAVTHSGGPLVVLAGPGTGKTRVIAHRVAHLMLEREVRPEEIVALTFTVKAAEQMRSRIGGLLREAGVEHSRRASSINIHTYHGLGHRLVRRFADRLGYGASPTLIDGAQQKRLLRDVIRSDRASLESLGEGVSAGAARVMATVKALGDYAIGPEEAVAWTAGWGERLAANADALEPEVLAGKRARQRLLAWECGVYASAAVEMRRRGWLTMNDLLTEPLRLLRNDGLVRDLLRGEFRHAVVDEFQDVNQATILLLERLFPPDRRPDLCVVGDDDQAIYAFRGADDRAFAKFSQRWAGHKTVRLEENYRSAPAIVGIANSVMSRADERFDPEKRVAASGGEKAALPGAGAMAATIGTRGDWCGPIVAMLLDERRRFPERPWRRTAIIARGHGTLERVATALEAEGIPYERRRGGNPLHDAGVADLMAWCRLLVDPRDVESGRRILSRPPVAFVGPRVIRLLEEYAAVGSLANEGEGEDPGAFLPWVAGKCPSDGAVGRAAGLYAEFRERVAGEPACELLYELALRIDAVHADLLPSKGRAARLRAVVSMLRFGFDRQERLEAPGNLRAFLEYFDDLSDREQEGLEDSARVDGEEQGDDEDGEGGVQLLTAHACKGLEFDTVFVARTNPTGGFPSPAKDAGPLPAELLAQQGTTDEFKQRVAAEERRLFYVACTRAERRLVLVGEVPKKPTGTHFLVELLAERAGLPGFEVVDGRSIVESLGLDSVDPLRAELSEGVTVKQRRELVDWLSSKVRIEAAATLERAAKADLSAEDLRRAQEELAAAARRMSLLAHAHAKGNAPAWSDGDASDAALVDAVKRATAPEDRGEGIVIQRVKGPLRLSYTQIKDFIACPGCWYLKYRLGLSPPASRESDFGIVVHEALCDFYGRWARADAEGVPHPGVEELIEEGRRRLLMQATSRGQGVDSDELARLKAMLRNAHTLHGRDGRAVEIIEKPELTLTFPFGEHTIKAQIDRIERMESGGVRIVDYKTGKDWKSLTQPERDDLQMGIYAMAIDHHFGRGASDGGPTPGVAEYWLLASGTVGSINLEQLNRKKIGTIISDAISGMLGGSYPAGEKCRSGLCRLMLPGVVVEP